MDQLERVISQREYHKIPELLEDIDTDQYITVELTTPSEIIQLLHQANVAIRFSKNYQYRGWMDIPNIIKNSPAPFSVRVSSSLDFIMMTYCQIARIPYILNRTDGNQEDWINIILRSNLCKFS